MGQGWRILQAPGETMNPRIGGLTLRSTRTLSLRASVLKQLSVRVPQQ